MKVSVPVLKMSRIIIPFMVMVMCLLSCGGSTEDDSAVKPSVTPQTASVEATVKKTSTPTSSTKTSGQSISKNSIPKITDLSFTLTLDADQEYTENTTPIFLQASQILHINWLVAKGDHFYMTFSLPSGNTMSINSNGSILSQTTDDSNDGKLTRNGDIVIKPAENDWSDGYYIFHSFLTRGDPAATIKLLYWIE